MAKAKNTPAEEVPQWPLIIAVCLLALGAALNRRLGNDGLALVLAAGAVILPVVGFCVHVYRGRRKTPRIRRVFVDVERHGASMPLDTAKYLPPPRYGPPPPDGAAPQT